MSCTPDGTMGLSAFNVVYNLPGLTELHEKLTFLWSNSHSILMTIILSRENGNHYSTSEFGNCSYLSEVRNIPTCHTFFIKLNCYAQLVKKQIQWFPVVAVHFAMMSGLSIK